MRKLALLTMTVVAALAMTAASATAATQVRNSSGTLCSPVSPAINASNVGLMSTTRNYLSGGCTVRMSGSVSIYPSYYENVRVTCNVAFDAHISGDGWGYADNYTYTNCGGWTVTPCAGDRYIAPPSYAGGPFGTGFVYKDAATDLNTEQCAVVNGGSNRWGHSSQDITTSAYQWQWADQYNSADSFNPSAAHTHRHGLVLAPVANALTITH